MTTESANRIRESFKLLSPRMEQLTRDVYDCMFRTRPDIRPLFAGDMRTQQQHLSAALGLIVRNLTMLEALEGSFKQLGADHARAGVHPEHYPLVRDAMLEAMSAALGANGAWTNELARDWRDLINQVCTYMLQGGLTATANGLDVRW
jgi:hemoglobin-like flavoprotein